MDKDRRRSQPIPHLSKHIHPYPFVTRKNPALMKTKENPAISYPLGQSSLFLGPEGRANVFASQLHSESTFELPKQLLIRNCPSRFVVVDD